MREEAVGGLHHSRRLPENGSLGIKRLVFKGLQQVIGEPQVLILTGPRQVGKATLMRHLESKCQAPGKRTRCLDLARRPASQQRQCGKRQCGTPIKLPRDR